MSAELCGIPLAHVVMNASGTLDALAAADALGDAALGCAAHVTKTVTLEVRPGNPPPRIAPAPSGLLNSIGLQNPGIDAFCADVLPAIARAVGVPVIASAGGAAPDGYARVVEAFDRAAEVQAIELNLSCPNVRSGCLQIGSDAGEIAALLDRLRPLTAKPLLAKLSPSVADIAPLARAAVAGGADALVLTNTVRGTAVRRSGERGSVFGGGGGGLSGPAIRAAALHCVLVARDAVDVPIVGLGGIANVEDARDFLRAGATHVAVGTALFRDPWTAARIGATLAGAAR